MAATTPSGCDNKRDNNVDDKDGRNGGEGDDEVLAEATLDAPATDRAGRVNVQLYTDTAGDNDGRFQFPPTRCRPH